MRGRRTRRASSPLRTGVGRRHTALPRWCGAARQRALQPASVASAQPRASADLVHRSRHDATAVLIGVAEGSGWAMVTVDQPGHICAGTGACPCHICTGTGLRVGSTLARTGFAVYDSRVARQLHLSAVDPCRLQHVALHCKAACCNTAACRNNAVNLSAASPSGFLVAIKAASAKSQKRAASSGGSPGVWMDGWMDGWP